MQDELNNRIVAILSKYISKEDKLAPYLCRKLDISRGSVYRRLKNEIPFTFEEISILSKDLGFSIDDIVHKTEKNRAYFDIRHDVFKEPVESFRTTLEDHYNRIMALAKAEKSESIISLDRIPAVYAAGFDNLSKFFYFKWLRQCGVEYSGISFTDMTMPGEILSLFHKIGHASKLESKNTFIIEENTILNTIKEIQYYYKIKLINMEELELLKKELLGFMKYIEKLIRNGINNNNAKYYFYLSTLEIGANSSVTIADDDVAAHFWIHFVDPIIVNNETVCNIHRDWLNSLKKYSILITHSGEIIREEFLNKQYEAIENMTHMMY